MSSNISKVFLSKLSYFLKLLLMIFSLYFSNSNFSILFLSTTVILNPLLNSNIYLSISWIIVASSAYINVSFSSLNFIKTSINFWLSFLKSRKVFSLISIKFDMIIFSKSILFLISCSFILYSLYIFGDKYRLKIN